jgi:hypothetical protein
MTLPDDIKEPVDVHSSTETIATICCATISRQFSGIEYLLHHERALPGDDSGFHKVFPMRRENSPFTCRGDEMPQTRALKTMRNPLW